MNKSKVKGSVTEIKVKLAFIELGYNVSTPYGDCELYDFIADVDGKLIKIQCKSATEYEHGGGFRVDLRKNIHASGGKMVKALYPDDSIDYFATCYNDQVYLIDKNKCTSRMLLKTSSIRKTINNAKSFEIKTVLDQIKGSDKL